MEQRTKNFKSFVKNLIVAMLLTHAAILGAWLAGESIGFSWFVLAAFFSYVIAVFTATLNQE